MSEMIATRIAYGKILAKLGEQYKDIVVLDADVSKCTMTCTFATNFPDRFFNMGIAEADMMSTAAGMATCGKIAFASTFAIFAVGRALDQIRNFIAYPNLNVKICATHSGISVGEDGATHQSVEDIAIMRAIPNMVVVNPADAVETEAAIKAAVEHQGPVYIRLGRVPQPVIFDSADFQFNLGKGIIVHDGDDVSIIATGLMVEKSIRAAEILKSTGIGARVIDMHTIKPIDKDLILKAAMETKAVVTVEEHNVIGGLGGAVAEFLAQRYPTKMKCIGIEDTFGTSGNVDELLQIFGLEVKNIVQGVKEILRS